MSDDAMSRLSGAFGRVVARMRQERKRSIEDLATACGLTLTDIQSIEAGSFLLTFTDLFRLAAGVGQSPIILLIEVINEWRSDPTDLGLYKSRPSDLTRLYRLGYYHNAGDFREHSTTFGHLDHAIAAARILNTTRHSKRLPLLDTVLLYVRFTSIRFSADEIEEKNETGKGAF